MSGRGALAELLAAKGHGTIAENIWLGIAPASTTYPAIGVGRYGGSIIERFGQAAEQQPQVQVFITGVVDMDDETEALADAIVADLTGEGRFTLDGTAIEAVRATSAVLPLGADSEGHPIYSCNFEVTYG